MESNSRDMMMELNDRIRTYEGASRAVLLRRVPVIIRVDGRAFHTWCRGLKKPFDHLLSYAMELTAALMMRQMQGCKAAYLASDEVSFLLTDYDTIRTDPWFGYVVQKVASVAASMFTAIFNMKVGMIFIRSEFNPGLATFDARAFNVPREDVSNYFLWRARDWERNSLSMYARSFFSHKKLHKKGREEIHEMLHKVGRNWAKDISNQERNGLFLLRNMEQEGGYIYRNTTIMPKYEQVAAALEPLLRRDKKDDDTENGSDAGQEE